MEMCQRFQKPATDLAMKGKRKFSRKWKPNMRPRPMAMSE